MPLRLKITSVRRKKDEKAGYRDSKESHYDSSFLDNMLFSEFAIEF